MLEYPLSDHPLARRIEAACVRDLQAFLDVSRDTGVYADAACMRVGGGAAFWFSPGNVVNGSFGLGMDREVEREEVESLIRFFEEREAPASIDVCPHADRSLFRWLAEAGFVAAGFEMVLYQPLPAPRPPMAAPGVEVRIAKSAEDRTRWADIETQGFSEGEPTEAHRELSRAMSLREDALQFTAYLGGEAVGTGALEMWDGVALLNSDSTLAPARNRGVQTSLLGARLTHAFEKGCDLCVIEAAPGGTSFRNQQRAGFRVAYNRVTLELPRRRR